MKPLYGFIKYSRALSVFCMRNGVGIVGLDMILETCYSRSESVPNNGHFWAYFREWRSQTFDTVMYKDANTHTP